VVEEPSHAPRRILCSSIILVPLPTNACIYIQGLPGVKQSPILPTAVVALAFGRIVQFLAGQWLLIGHR
jgi:hypothetical protein